MAGLLFRRLFKAAASFIAVSLFALSNAHGFPMTLKLHESGYADLTVSCPAGSPCSYIGPFGTFSTNLVGGTSLGSPTSLDLTSANVSTATPGTLVITLTETGVTNPVGMTSWLQQFVGSFNPSPGVTVSSADYVNGIALPVLVCTSTPCALAATTPVNGLTAPYDLTEVITIVSTGANIFSLDESLTGTGTIGSAPEPISLALLGIGLIAMGAIRRHRRRV